MAKGRQVAQSEIQNFEAMTMKVDYPEKQLFPGFYNVDDLRQANWQ